MSRDARDLAAEQALLGSVLATPDIAGPALLSLPLDAWWSEKHRMLAELLADRLRRGQPVDVTTVLGDVLDRGGPYRDQAGPWLFSLYQRVLVPGNPGIAAAYADRIREVAGRRNLALAAIRLGQRLDRMAEGYDDDLHFATAEMRGACDHADESVAATQRTEPQTLAELLAEPDTHDWLVPGLLERMDRLIVTGVEGLGKTELTATFACCLAAGQHPFTGAVLGAGNHQQRVLVVDFENSASQSRRRYRRIATAVDLCRSEARCDPIPWRDAMRIEVRPEGTNLLDSREVAWLQRLVGVCAPDVMVLGPLYKLHHANISDETAAREMTAVLDDIRVKHGCALLMEAHAGHAEDGNGSRRMRPCGSSLFLRWPDFGFGLRQAKDDPGAEHPQLVDVVAWRGFREERQWPNQLKRGRRLSWEPADPGYEGRTLRSVS